MLCDACHDIFRSDKWTRGAPARTAAEDAQEYAIHHISKATFTAALNAGCHLCGIAKYSPQIKRALADEGLGNSPFTYIVKRRERFYGCEDIPYLWLYPTAADPMMTEVMLPEFKLELLAQRYFPANERRGSDCTNSPIIVNQIEDWISTCVSDHKICGESSNPSFTPTRLLDVGESGPGDHVRLVISSEHFKSSRSKCMGCRYMTLSHRWGGANILKLTSATETALRQCIAFDSLPKTFQEFIKLARQLRVRYLWIDALCIIQGIDDAAKNDWLAEGAKMAYIYKNSYCNIAATSALDSYGGLFFHRDASLATTTFVQPVWEPTNANEFALALPHKELMRILDEEPLLKRGWVQQERLLAPRVLHFTKHQVFFECHHHLACEILPEGIPDLHGERCPKHIAQHFIHLDIDADEELRRGERKAIIEWNQLVERYSGCDLTFTGDRLMALSGIATHFSQTKLLGEKYLAGIWESQLPYALLWCRGKPTTKPEDYCAPSWSWASATGAVDMSRTERHRNFLHADLAEVFEAEITTKSDNPTGPVSAGIIRLGCIIAMAHVRGDEIFQVSRMTDHLLRVKISGRILRDVQAECERDAVQVPIALIQYRSSDGGGPGEVTHMMDVTGLALRAGRDGTYERVGLVVLYERTGQMTPRNVLQFLHYPRVRTITLV